MDLDTTLTSCPRAPWRRLLVAVSALVALLAVLVPAAPAGALTDAPSAEQEFLVALNQTRVANGKPMLAYDAAASDVARKWSQTMASQVHLHHNPNVAAEVGMYVTKDWTRIGENVGYGWSVDSLHQAFWDSLGHRANILGQFNRVGVGVVVTDRIWVTFVFIEAPGVPAQPACSAPGYVLDGWGGVHATGGAPKLSTAGYWPGWNIARDLSLAADGKGGQKLDGFGGLHPVGNGAKLGVSGYWRGWDVARAVAVTPDGKGAYVLDAYGGIHQAGNAPARKSSGYWPGWAIARDIVVDPTDGTRGYVLDGFGGLHPFGGMPKAWLSTYFGRDVAVAVTMFDDGTGGYVTDRFGGVYPFAVHGNAMPKSIGPTVSFAGRAVGVLLDDVSAVPTSAGGFVGAGGAGCGSPNRWPDGLARAAVSL